VNDPIGRNLILLLLITASIFGGEHFLRDEEPLTVCELLAASSSFTGKVIAVRGIQVATDEGAWLKADDCKPIVTKRYTWPAAIWLDMSRTRLEAAHFSYKRLQDDIARINEQLRQLGVVPKRRQIVLTYIGRFEAVLDKDKRVDEVNGVPRGIGLGHGNWAPAEMVVKEVRDLTVRTDATLPR
jgi:hypothetical protein